MDAAELKGTPHGRVVREDSGGLHYLQWKGPVTSAGSDEFSQHNRHTAQQLVVEKYPKMVLDGKPYSIRVELEENFDEVDNVSWALQCVLQAITNSDGHIKPYNNNDEMINAMKLYNVRRGFEGLASSSDGESDEDGKDEGEGAAKKRRVMDENGYLSDTDLHTLVPLALELGKNHQLLHGHIPIFGNDTVKNFLASFFRFCLFDVLKHTNILISTNNCSSSQVLGLSTTAVHVSTNSRARITIKGVPDVGIQVTNSKNETKKVLYCEGKSLDDEYKGVSGEGQLVLAMLCGFLEFGGAHNIYGILLSPSKVVVLCVRKCANTVMVKNLFTTKTNHATSSLLDYSHIIYYVRKAVSSVL